MRYPKHGLRVLCLSFIAVLGPMAFMVVGAQAQELRILGAKAGATETGTGSAVTEFLFLVPPQNLIVHCAIAEYLSFTELTNGTIHAEVHYRSCVTLQKEVISKGCKPLEPITLKGLDLIILHNGKNYILVEPSKNAKGEFEPLMTIRFNEETCALPSENAVTGSYVLECLTEAGASGNCNEELVTHKMAPAPAALFEGDKLLSGKNPASILGITQVKLSGAKVGCKWSLVI